MHSFAWWPTVIVLAVATFTDLRNRRIPNWLVVPFLVAGIGTSVLTAEDNQLIVRRVVGSRAIGPGGRTVTGR